jgi:hypothetical protein
MAKRRTKANTKPEHEQPKPEQIQPEQANPNTLSAELKELRDSLTKTDKTFFDRAIRDFGYPYYNYDSFLKEGTCIFCKKPFKTNLSLNRYCSYQHYADDSKKIVGAVRS